VSLDFEIIGPYQVVRIIGQGGMGTVYQGVNAKTKEPVAIKVISAGLAQHQRFRRRFDSEIQTLLKLKHPNIVQLIGFGEEKGLLFYSMEYVDGENLQQQLRREKTLPWERVVDLAIEICSALKHAHDFGIIHRDLKPANIMINSQNKIKLTDFGIAKLFGAADSTVEGSVLGTADYMPPEQAEGKPVSVRSDLYSLGSLCYAALAGRPPFTGKNIPEILFNVRYGSLTPLASLAPEVPKELCDLVEELLRREPSMRPPTGLVVGNRLQSLRAGLSKRARDKATEKTEVRNLRELTSIDMSDTPSLASEFKSIRPGDETILAANGNREIFGEDRSPPASMPNREPTHLTAPSVAGPNDKTRLASGNSEFEYSEHPSGIDYIAKTNFTEVDDNDRRRSSIVVAEPEYVSPWSHWLSVGGLVATLAACAFGIFWFSRPPSANVLYEQIASAIQSSDEEQITDVEPIAERFKELYPNDTRMADVDSLLAEIESLRSIRQLQRRAKRGGSDQLDPVEQAFLECIKAQSIDSELAQRKFKAMVTVFASGEKLSSRQRQFVEQAKRMSDQLAKETKPARNPAIDAIQEQMTWADANLSTAARMEWLRSLVELFEDKVWARELVALAKTKLSSTGKNASDPKELLP
jgi:serine/threonine protein kinase